MIIDGPRRREQLAAVSRRLPAHVARLAWSADQISRERQRALRETLAFAKAKSPWHSRRLESIEPQSFTEADLQRLPVMTKTDVMANWDEIVTDRRAHSAGAQSALGKRPATQSVFRPALINLADRIGSRLRAKLLSGRTVTARVRFADLHAVTRSVTLPAPISATSTLAEVAEELVRSALADHPRERYLSLLAISVSHLERQPVLQLELPLGLADEKHRPGTRKGAARWMADKAVDKVRDRFGWEAIGYGPVALDRTNSVPDAFRELAQKEL